LGGDNTDGDMTSETVAFQSRELQLVVDVAGSRPCPTVLFLHAGGETRRVWSPVASILVTAGWRTVAPDLRGHGSSGRAVRYRLDDFIDDAARLAEALCDRPLVVVGGSIGGAVGLLLEGEGRARIDGLVLLDVPTAPAPDVAQRERSKIRAAQAQGVPAVASLDPAFLAGPFVDDVLDAADRWRQAARRVRVPTLLVRGRRSAAVGPDELSKLAEDMPHAEVISVDAGHLVARDQPEAVAQLLIKFLREFRAHSR